MVVGGLSLFGILYNISKGDFNYLLLIGLVILFYTVYNYLIPEIGASFLIPHSKIKSIEMNDGDVTIYFIDFEEKEDRFDLKGLDEKGMEVLLKINVEKASKND